jgi:endo-1,4-beta-D-glucanase Y
MDWVDYVPGDGFYPAPAHPDKDAARPGAGPGGSYDAIRVYLWAGMLDGQRKTRDEMLSAVPAMSVLPCQS